MRNDQPPGIHPAHMFRTSTPVPSGIGGPSQSSGIFSASMRGATASYAAWEDIAKKQCRRPKTIQADYSRSTTVQIEMTYKPLAKATSQCSATHIMIANDTPTVIP